MGSRRGQDYSVALLMLIAAVSAIALGAVMTCAGSGTGSGTGSGVPINRGRTLLP